MASRNGSRIAAGSIARLATNMGGIQVVAHQIQQVHDQVRDQASFQVDPQLDDQIWHSVGTRFWWRVGSQVSRQVFEELRW